MGVTGTPAEFYGCTQLSVFHISDGDVTDNSHLSSIRNRASALFFRGWFNANENAQVLQITAVRRRQTIRFRERLTCKAIKENRISTFFSIFPTRQASQRVVLREGAHSVWPTNSKVLCCCLKNCLANRIRNVSDIAVTFISSVAGDLSKSNPGGKRQSQTPENWRVARNAGIINSGMLANRSAGI